jgi:hypothetical protein
MQHHGRHVPRRPLDAVVIARSHVFFLTLAYFCLLRFSLWGQPAQQQGRRFPSLSSMRTLSIRLRLVSSFLASSTQQIHSLRASGVISSQLDNATLSEKRAFRKSSGTLCTTPVEISFLTIAQHYYLHFSGHNCIKIEHYIPSGDMTYQGCILRV